uniref:Uncharacterized protein n=1 Tax=Gallus gallus TaxID=9031 RepID=A0A8V0XA75_CHICK
MVTYYVCVRGSGSQTISVREPQHLEKWNIANNQLPRRLKRPEPSVTTK